MYLKCIIIIVHEVLDTKNQMHYGFLSDARQKKGLLAHAASIHKINNKKILSASKVGFITNVCHR